MYCDFFGFSVKPFDVTADSRFFYFSAQHREAFSTLLYGIRERRGIITLTGEPGTGKTVVINRAVDQLGLHTRAVHISGTDAAFEHLLGMVLVDLGLATPGEVDSLSRVESLHLLRGFATRQASQGGELVLIVDEAQNLDQRSLENLRLLSNLETRRHKLIQIILSGQLELESTLNRPQLQSLAQRVSLRRSLTPLGEKDTRGYIRHRLNTAGYHGPPLFSSGSEKLIRHYSDGVPRKINTLCDNTLLTGFALKLAHIKEEVVMEAAGDLGWIHPSPSMKTPATLRSHKFPPRPKTVPRREAGTSRPWNAVALGLILAVLFAAAVANLFGTNWFKM